MEDISRHKDLLRAKQRELRMLLNKWDPIGVSPLEGGPVDEYDCFFWLVGELYRGRPTAALAKRLRNELEHHFGVDPDDPDPDAFAARVYAWYWSDPIPGSLQPGAGNTFLDPRPVLIAEYEEAVHRLREEMGRPTTLGKRWRFHRARRRLWMELVEKPQRTTKW